MDNKLFETTVSGVGLLYNDLKIHFIAIDYNARTRAERTAMHVHDFYEFYMILDGRQYTTVRDYEFVTSQREFFLVPPGVEHGHRHFPDNGDDGILVRFAMEKRPATPGCLQIADRVIQTLSTTHIRALHDRQIEEMLIDVPAKAPVEQLHLRMLCWIMRLCELYESDVCVAPRHSRPLVFSSQDLVQRVLITISTLFMTDLSVKDIAAAHSISYRHLSRIFLQQTGCTMVQAITCTRVRNAMRLLRDTALPIREIAHRSGFRSEGYFTSVFTKFVGQPPSAYRASPDPSAKCLQALADFEARTDSLPANAHPFS